MMCDECGVRPANFLLKAVTEDGVHEKNLCPVCMAKYQKKIPGLDFSGLAGCLYACPYGMRRVFSCEVARLADMIASPGDVLQNRMAVFCGCRAVFDGGCFFTGVLCCRLVSCKQ